MTFPIFNAPRRRVDRVFIHCSASDNPEHDDVSIIRKWHMSPDPKDRTKPWRDVGYHFFIKFNGTVQRGRPLEITPAAHAPHNPNTIAICCSGFKKFSEPQFESLRLLCRSIAAAIPGVTFHGHCEVSSKACPVFDYKAVLSLDGRGRITNPQ
jgi:N-acetylmuramoyl-L-alanine amidase